MEERSVRKNLRDKFAKRSEKEPRFNGLKERLIAVPATDASHAFCKQAYIGLRSGKGKSERNTYEEFEAFVTKLELAHGLKPAQSDNTPYKDNLIQALRRSGIDKLQVLATKVEALLPGNLITSQNLTDNQVYEACYYGIQDGPDEFSPMAEKKLEGLLKHFHSKSGRGTLTIESPILAELTKRVTKLGLQKKRVVESLIRDLLAKSDIEFYAWFASMQDEFKA